MFEAECVVGRVPEIENSRTRGIEIMGERGGDTLIVRSGPFIRDCFHPLTVMKALGP